MAPWGRRTSQEVPHAGEDLITSFAAAAVRWKCERCGVSVGQVDGAPIGLPPTWTSAGSSTFCLTCSRALAGEAALESTPHSTPRDELFRLRRDAVIRFEIGRVPLAANREIANACHTSPKAVASIRAALDAP